MTDTPHAQEKEAYEDGVNRVLVCDGVQLGAVAITQRIDEVTGSTESATGVVTATVTGANNVITFAPSQDLQAAIALWKAAQASPPPSDPTPSDPVPTPSDPPTGTAPTVTGQILIADKTAIRVGDTFTVSAVLNYSDGSAKPVGSYRLYGYDGTIVTTPAPSRTTFTALAAGTTTIRNDFDNTTGKLAVTVLPAASETPPSDPTTSDPTSDDPVDPPPDEDDPAPVPQPGDPTALMEVAVSGATVTVKDVSTKGEGNLKTARIDFGDGERPLLCRTGSRIPYVYPTAGTRTITLTVYDSLGKSNTVTQDVTTTVDMPGIPAIDGDVTVRGMQAGGETFVLAPAKGERIAMPFGGTVKHYGDGACVCVENMTLGTTGDLFVYVIIEANGRELFRGNLALWAYAGAQPFWINEPACTTDFDHSLFPTYGAGSENAPSLYRQCMNANNGPMGTSMWCRGLGNTGERMDLGPLDGASVRCLTNPSDENIAVMRMLANAVRVFSFHMIDPATMKMVSLNQNPKISMDGGLQGAYGNLVPRCTSATPISLSQAAAHAPTFSALACAMRRSDYDREELAMWANYVGGLWANWSNRLPCGVTDIEHGQTRGKGRAFNVILYASRLSDAPDYFANWVQASLQDMHDHWTTQTGVQVDQYDAVYAGGKGYASWQQWIVLDALGRALDHGYTAAQPVLDYFATWQLDCLFAAQHEFASLSTQFHKDGNGNLVPNYLAGLQYAATRDTKDGHHLAAAMACPENSQELLDALYPGVSGYHAGNFANHPWSATGYVAQMQMSVVAVANHATDPRAAQAWPLFADKGRPAIQWNGDHKYDIVPRAA
jgi:hypothetical protein